METAGLSNTQKLHTAAHTATHTVVHTAAHAAPHAAPHTKPHKAPHAAPHGAPHTVAQYLMEQWALTGTGAKKVKKCVARS